MTFTHWTILLLTLTICACSGGTADMDRGAEPGSAAEHDEETRGPHGGRLLVDGDFRIELTIFEDGVAPRFRAYAFLGGQPLDPGSVHLEVETKRLGGKRERFELIPRDDFLEAAGTVGEPHSFIVHIGAAHSGTTHEWHYDSFEGRTRIDAAMARESGIETKTAGPATIRETLVLHGTIVPDPQRVFRLRARFPGVVKEIRKRIGEAVRAGDVLAVIEANESLQRYNIVAPAAGVVVAREVNPGAAVEGEMLLTVVDLSSVWVELAAFQHDLGRILSGQSVIVRDVDGRQSATGWIESIAPLGSAASQSMTARVVLPNPEGLWRPGLFVTGEVTVAETEAPVAVSRTALQSFRDWIVVFEQAGEEYEARPVTLGRQDGEWVEILSGIEPGAHYVGVGSYLVKSDIEKAGATHDH